MWVADTSKKFTGHQLKKKLSCDPFYLLAVDVQGYYCILSQSLTHTHTHTHTHTQTHIDTHTHISTHLVGLPSAKDRPIAKTCTCQQTTLTNSQTYLPPAGIEPAIPASERPHTHTIYIVFVYAAAYMYVYIYIYRHRPFFKPRRPLGRVEV
jgi:hypothetical protein